MSHDKFLERYDSYVVNNYQSRGQVYITVELVSIKWYRFNKIETFAAEQTDDTWRLSVLAKRFITRCENHFGY